MRFILPFLAVFLGVTVHLYVASPVLRGAVDQKSGSNGQNNPHAGQNNPGSNGENGHSNPGGNGRHPGCC
ncbi:hypothetical protein PtA15_16A317 [Puccinia triticina]|uniref:Uncharacterized protein n=1 Tax=Puccinia triticina TaxID=208348 RepID=A0ABY7D6K9_9BASI|nr:uncharacterized protein PtA15_16A317 [Puccinia triticina]WAQ92409.1 hypothetical protein PtA15_16A317 [Puccinia triticina]